MLHAILRSAVPLALVAAPLAAAPRADLELHASTKSVRVGLVVGGPGGLRLSAGKHASYGHPAPALVLEPACHVPRRVVVPAGHVVVRETVWVPGRTRRIRVEPVRATRHDARGRTFTVIVAPGHWRTVHEPGHYETVERRVRRDAHGAPAGS